MFSKAGTLTGIRWGKGSGTFSRFGKGIPAYENPPNHVPATMASAK